MRRELAVLAIAFAAMSASPAAGQARATSRDPISGNWGEDGHPLLRLRLDDKGTVSGSVVAGRPTNLAEIKSGSFDARTSTLKIEGDAKHPDTGAAVHFIIQGRLDGDTLRVDGTFGSDHGSKTLTRSGAAAGAKSPPHQSTR